MRNHDKYVNEITEKFQANRGKASLYCFKPFNFAILVSEIVAKYRVKHPADEFQILMVVDEISNRMKLISELANRFCNQNIKVMTEDYVNNKKYKYAANFTILINTFDEEKLLDLEKQSIFTLAIFTKPVTSNDFIINIRKYLPDITSSISARDVDADKLNMPVKEYRRGADLSDEDKLTYDKYTRFIEEAIQVFGSFENAEKCRVGDNENNISASEYRYLIAKQNNWSPNIDISLEYNKQIDELFNPNVLQEKATLLYNICRERRNLITDNKEKFKVIENIVNENQDKKILIVSMRTEFANAIYDYLNDINVNKCGIYHGDIESRYLTDANGRYITYKSGENKGKPKPFGATVISKMMLEQFNDDTFNCLSIKNSSDKKLKTRVDIIIFTSPFCLSYEDFILRYNNVEFNGNPETYRLYSKNTIEFQKMINASTKNNITIIEEEKDIQIDENSGDIIL